MGQMVARMDRALYPDFGKNWDDVLFRRRVLDHLTNGKDKDVLDLGAGAGILEHMNFRGLARRVCGIDPDPRVLENRFVDDARVGFGEEILYEDDSFDLVLANNVLEHLEDPDRVFQEVKRVLKPGGIFLAKTPNRRHYVAAIGVLTPDRFHQWVGRIKHRHEGDTFPTRYRANTRSAIRRIAANTGLKVNRIELIEGRPEYLRFSFPTYLLGWMYERVVNRFRALAGFRVLLIVELQKVVRGTRLSC